MGTLEDEDFAQPLLTLQEALSLLEADKEGVVFRVQMPSP
jgi:hypothetical protein